MCRDIRASSLAAVPVVVVAGVLLVRLRRRHQRLEEEAEQNQPVAEGFFGIGIVAGKTAGNIGTLWRSAYQLGASFTFTIGARHAKFKEDTAQCWSKIPAHSYADFAAFAASAPFGTQLVAVEMGGTNLRDFVHPTRAVYLLGSEDNGLPAAVLRKCHHHVALPSVRSASYNVAVSGSLIMYDRFMKQNQNQPLVVRPSQPQYLAAGSEPVAGMAPAAAQPEPLCREQHARNGPETAEPAVSASSPALRSSLPAREARPGKPPGKGAGDPAADEGASDAIFDAVRCSDRALVLLRCGRPYRSRVADYLRSDGAAEGGLSSSARAASGWWRALRTSIAP